MAFELEKVMLYEPVPPEPIFLHHFVEHSYVIHCLQLLEVDVFVPLCRSNVCPNSEILALVVLDWQQLWIFLQQNQ